MFSMSKRDVVGRGRDELVLQNRLILITQGLEPPGIKRPRVIVKFFIVVQWDRRYADQRTLRDVRSICETKRVDGLTIEGA